VNVVSSSPAAPSERLRVLLVEDDTDCRETLDEALTMFGYAVTAVGDPRRALAVHPERFDVVITDMHMPGMSGLDLKRELDRRHVFVPVVLISSEDGVGSRSVEVACFDYLQKPFDLDQLQATVRHACARVEPCSEDLATGDDQDVSVDRRPARS